MKDQYLVKKIDRPVDWVVEVPGSKSMTNRALLMAALSDGRVDLDGVLFSEDSRHFLAALRALGFAVAIEEEKRHVTVLGRGGIIPNREAEINVGSAGTAARFLTAMLGFSDGFYTIQASEQMKKRPMKELFQLLSDAGAQITYLEKEGFLPVRVCGRNCGTKAELASDSGERSAPGAAYSPKSGQAPLAIALDISKSTQFLSALLLISPMIGEGLHIRITSSKTDGSYIRITRGMLAEAGVEVDFDGKSYGIAPGASYRKKHYQIEPDVSAACYFYAAAALTGGRTLVRRVHRDNSQGDMKFLAVLEKMGCTVTERSEGIEVEGPAGGRLRGLTVDMNDFSDQALTLAALAPFADSAVRIANIGHIRGQECDRLHAIAAELGKRGIRCQEEADAVTIYPGTVKPGVVETYEDHRVAMAFSLLGLRADGIVIDNPGCCKKTFEQYFELLESLTAEEKEKFSDV